MLVVFVAGAAVGAVLVVGWAMAEMVLARAWE
jgi:hypothetical protein